MKVLVFVAIACLLSGANAAGFVDTLKGVANSVGSVFTNLFQDLKTPLATVANTLVDNLKTAGTQLLATGAQSLLGSLSHVGAPATRDTDLLTGVSKFVTEGKSVVAKLSETLGSLYHSAMTSLTNIAQRISSMDFLKEPLDKILSEIKNVVNIHDIFQNSLVETITKNPGQFLIKAAEGLISKLGNKRSALTDTLSSVGQQFASLFKPVVDAVKQHVSTLGSTLSSTATALFGAVKPTLDQLSTQLSGHVQALKDSATELLGHGQNALKALSAAAGDIMTQTMGNMKPTLQKIVDTGKDAVQTITNTLGSN
ncbi:uncharacterized protein LOC124257447 [Haliotis rubra]|uniref:uncharacterized protein LOC124257447 n=1 Tax=Haliotis rubra TaxID=36100 RepID=UPI001EE63168|nr:uncharacterized protein LOC124257447 [Haliotis rubra]